ncbi:cysteine hydrolase family protein [Acetivibrio mesophilus]|uniref:Cysteine hydrolase n=1 Tax=Acetivibrio mesophilus TaxID=2487273 RepID=A0A4Q0I6H5_9FIRM|nr:isochorismatase family cysteine hydrolase [Acetivibrio mesophilus]ODM25039.1 isochorismatase [Clostridium sp. Bc-iso-3]RXE59961.1 cysteine hydrolase [Acetivibrio mesophilus]HHV29453.1 cysteine hydrolase [Clostridium sp.]
MKIVEKNEFIQKSNDTLLSILDMLEKLPVVRFGEIEADKAALIIIDMTNGFAKEGALKSDAVEELIPKVCELSAICDKLKIRKIAFADCHTDESPEFDAYPKHCLKGTAESEIVDEIKNIGGYTLIEKNSTNGFLEEAFRNWLSENPDINTFILTGDCTDICVQQFATTLRAYYNKNNKRARVIVPLNAVDTYDLGQHDRNLMNVMAAYNMIINGVEVVEDIIE